MSDSTDQRRDINALPLDAKYWIVTVDYRFLAFDKFKTNNSSVASVCMLPIQFIQVMRFFTPRSANFEKMMLGTMRFPLAVRDYDPGTERIALKIIRQLARFEGIEDLSVEMIQKVIMDEGLNLKLAEVRHSEVEETELIHDVLMRQLAEYEEKLDTYKQAIEQKEIALGESERTRQENEHQMSRDIISLKEQVLQLENDKRTEQEYKKKADSINAYKKLCALIILPFLFLLAIMWYSVILLVRPLVLSYSISALVSLVVSIFITRFLLQAGQRDPYVLKTDFFQSVNKKFTLTVIISFLLSSIWSIAVELIAQLLIPKK